MSKKTFSTLAVASAATGIGMGSGLTFALMSEISAHVLGYPVWTHELGDKQTAGKVHDALRLQFPELPTREEAEADWLAAAIKATSVYGPTVSVIEGDGKREEGPIASLTRMLGDSPHA